MQRLNPSASWNVFATHLVVGAFCVGFFLIAPLCDAAILTVAPNGAQYSTIQAAVDAAASGDTVLVAPGRYTDAHWVPTAAGDRLIYVKVGVEELTLIGSGSEATIVGSYAPYNGTASIGIAGGTLFGNRQLFVRGIGFENLQVAFDGTTPVEYAVFSDCGFSSNWIGSVTNNGGDLTIISCAFQNQLGSTALSLHRQNNVRIQDCEFELPASSGESFEAVHCEGCRNVTIDSGTFSSGAYGVSIVDCDTCTISSSVFSNQSRCNVLLDRTDGFVIGCEITGLGHGILLNSILSNFRIVDSSISSVQWGTIGIIGVASLEVMDCRLVHGQSYVVDQIYDCEKTDNGDVPILNLTNNDWGTTDPDTIASWIHLCDYEADFMPYVGQVANDAQTWDGFKALFR